MKRYRFSLDSVLRARRASEERARQELARANRHLLESTERYRAEAARYQALVPPAGPVEAARFLTERAQRELVAATLTSARSAMHQAAAAARAQQGAWQAARRHVRVLERLDSRRRSEHRNAVLRAEAAELDDIVSARWAAGVRRPATGRGER